MNRVEKVVVLGTEYKITFDDADDKELGGKLRMGYCFIDAREIHIADLETSDEWKKESKESKDRCTRGILRHELVHAFLAESGLWGSTNKVSSWAMNEEMVDWIALQFPKLLKAFQECDCCL